MSAPGVYGVIDDFRAPRVWPVAAGDGSAADARTRDLRPVRVLRRVLAGGGAAAGGELYRLDAGDARRGPVAGDRRPRADHRRLRVAEPSPDPAAT